jgi:hypothetical protein
MPVLLTTTIVAFMLSRNSGGNRASFLDPTSLREGLEDLSEGETRERALGVADDFDRIARDYAVAAQAAMDAYEVQSARWTTSATELIEELKPQDAAFARLLEEVIGVRQALLGILSPQEWEQLFG